MKNLIVIAGMVFFPVSHAGVLEYGASLDQSIWKMASETPLECRLEHIIPGWGKGAFVSYAGKNINMDFELKPLRPQARSRLLPFALCLRPGVRVLPKAVFPKYGFISNLMD